MADGGSSDFDAVFDALDRASIDPAEWESVCYRISDLVDATGAALMPGQRAARTRAMPSTESVERAKEYYVDNDMALRDVRERGIPKMLRTGFMTDADNCIPFDQHSKHPYYQEFLAPAGLRWFVGMGFTTEGGAGFGLVTIQGSDERGPFLQDRIEKLEKVRPAVQLAVRQAELFGWRRINSITEIIEPTSLGVLTLGWDGSARPLNDAAGLAAESAGLMLHGRLRHRDRQINGALSYAIDSVIRYTANSPHTLPGHITIRRSATKYYSLEFLPTPRDFPSIAQNVSAIGLLRERKHEPEISSILMSEYGLTKTEAALVEKLLAESSLKDSAEIMCIRYETARSYLKSIFDKTGAHSQVELIKLLYSLKYSDFRAGEKRHGPLGD